MADLSRCTPDSVLGTRPVIIVQNDKGNLHSGSVIAALITSRHKKYMPTHVQLYPECGIRKTSTVLCEHILTLEKDTLLSYIGTVVNTKAEDQLNAALAVSLSLAPPRRGAGRRSPGGGKRKDRLRPKTKAVCKNVPASPF